MSLLLSTHKLNKSVGSHRLFEGLSFGIHEGQKIGLLGPNGAGKSTLLKILSGELPADSGDVTYRKGLNFCYVAQEEIFPPGRTVISIATEALLKTGMDSDEASVQASIHLSMAGFEDFEILSEKLSGGWRKRLSLAIAFAQSPELLLLDEPTNHLDWDGILWLESQLKAFPDAFIMVSHDREFLGNLCSQYMEIHQVYQDGYLLLDCGYNRFIEKKMEYIEGQLSQQSAMANKARRELEWVRAGVKARTTKSRSRWNEAHELFDNLEEIKRRNKAASAKVNLRIDEGGKRSKKLLEAKNLEIFYGDHVLLKNFEITLGPKTCVGLLGDNASGKTSLLKVLSGREKNFRGDLFHADELKVVYFDQKRADLDTTKTILSYMGDGADHVMFRGQSIHVASYASRFLFPQEKLNLPISRLSGGEQARLLIAKILLRPADLLILDEPTNDLDIQTIEVLEEVLESFEGLVLLVSHDRQFLKRLCQKYIALNGKSGWKCFADLNQWLGEKNESEEVFIETKQEKPKSTKKVKLSYKDKRQLETIEADVEAAEKALEQVQQLIAGNDNFSDHEYTSGLVADLEVKQKKVEELYALWGELEDKSKNLD